MKAFVVSFKQWEMFRPGSSKRASSPVRTSLKEGKWGHDGATVQVFTNGTVALVADNL